MGAFLHLSTRKSVCIMCSYVTVRGRFHPQVAFCKLARVVFISVPLIKRYLQMLHHSWVLNRRSRSCRRVIDLLYFDGGVGKTWVRDRERRYSDEALLTAAWRQCFTVSFPSFSSEIVIFVSSLSSPIPCFLLFVSFTPPPFPYFQSPPPALPSFSLLPDTFVFSFLKVCCVAAESIKTVARSERPVLFSAHSEL